MYNNSSASSLSTTPGENNMDNATEDNLEASGGNLEVSEANVNASEVGVDVLEPA